MRSIGLVLLLGAMVVACKPPELGELVTVEQLCSDPKYDSHEEKGLAVKKRVTVEGYLDIPRGMVVLCGYGSCPASLLPTPDARDKAFSISLKVGRFAAQMKDLPDKFQEKDLVVHTTDGLAVGVGAKVRVTGSRLGTVKDKSCQLVDVDRVDAR
jgi:hypothetical protein